MRLPPADGGRFSPGRKGSGRRSGGGTATRHGSTEAVFGSGADFAVVTGRGRSSFDSTEALSGSGQHRQPLRGGGGLGVDSPPSDDNNNDGGCFSRGVGQGSSGVGKSIGRSKFRRNDSTEAHGGYGDSDGSDGSNNSSAGGGGEIYGVYDHVSNSGDSHDDAIMHTHSSGDTDSDGDDNNGDDDGDGNNGDGNDKDDSLTKSTSTRFTNNTAEAERALEWTAPPPPHRKNGTEAASAAAGANNLNLTGKDQDQRKAWRAESVATLEASANREAGGEAQQRQSATAAAAAAAVANARSKSGATGALPAASNANVPAASNVNAAAASSNANATNGAAYHPMGSAISSVTGAAAPAAPPLAASGVASAGVVAMAAANNSKAAPPPPLPSQQQQQAHQQQPTQQQAQQHQTNVNAMKALSSMLSDPTNRSPGCVRGSIVKRSPRSKTPAYLPTSEIRDPNTAKMTDAATSPDHRGLPARLPDGPTDPTQDCRPYAIDFISDAAGKHIKASKRRVLFRFGFAPPTSAQAVLEREHVVTLSWSPTSGRAVLAADGREVHLAGGGVSVVGDGGSAGIGSSKKRFQKKFEHRWTLPTNQQGSEHSLCIAAHAAKPRKDRQFDLYIDGTSYFDLPKCDADGNITPLDTLGRPVENEAVAAASRAAASTKSTKGPPPPPEPNACTSGTSMAIPLDEETNAILQENARKEREIEQLQNRLADLSYLPFLAIVAENDDAVLSQRGSAIAEGEIVRLNGRVNELQDKVYETAVGGMKENPQEHCEAISEIAVLKSRIADLEGLVVSTSGIGELPFQAEGDCSSERIGAGDDFSDDSRSAAGEEAEPNMNSTYLNFLGIMGEADSELMKRDRAVAEEKADRLKNLIFNLETLVDE